MPINFGAKLQGLTCGMGARRARVQHRAAVAQAGHALAIEQMCVNAGHLGGGIRSQP